MTEQAQTQDAAPEPASEALKADTKPSSAQKSPSADDSKKSDELKSDEKSKDDKNDDGKDDDGKVEDKDKKSYGKLRLVKAVVNDDGGTAGPGDWDLQVEVGGQWQTLTQGELIELREGTYRIQETGGPDGYTQINLRCKDLDDDGSPVRPVDRTRHARVCVWRRGHGRIDKFHISACVMHAESLSWQCIGGVSRTA